MTDEMTLRRRVDSTLDQVVLLDRHGRSCGVAVKADVHGVDTPLHLAFSCYVVGDDGRILLTERAAAKRMWPSVWTNACCGHPRPAEPMRDAVARHLRDELGLELAQLRCALADFTYRATMPNGLVEHEVCPVFVATVRGAVQPNPLEVDAVEWTTWSELMTRAQCEPATLSPWSVAQIERLSMLMTDPLAWITATPPVSQPPTARSGIPSLPIERDVDELVDRFLTDRERELGAMDPLVGELTNQIRLLIGAGGKRLRPLFVYWGHRAGDGATTPRRRPGQPRQQRGQHDVDDVSSAAAAIEMLHTFALLHDDVMDRSTVRRGAPAAHVQFAEIHRASHASGQVPGQALGKVPDDSSHFGSSAAIVAGDLAFVWADQLLDLVRAEPDTVRRVRSAFSLLRTEVIAGQYLDIRLAGSPATQRQAANIALLKSGRYTVTRPLEIGAALAGATDDTIEALRRYGDAAGVAFQLRDDVLGVFGDPLVTGKSALDDLRDGKASLLLVRALELADPAGRRLLEGSLGDPDLDPVRADQCREVIAGSGALASVERLIESSVLAASEAVGALDREVGGALVSLAGQLTERAA